MDSKRKFNLIIKRVIDFIGCLIGLVLLAPLFLIISLIIKFSSKGPIFFKQERLGKDGNVFRIMKFRTMVENAENIGDGLTVKNESDSRITKVGRLLRRTSLDELPQLFNVLVGQMSLVGPRPPVTYFPYNGYEDYPEWAKARFDMKPGITGLVQITVRNSVLWDDRIMIDIEYIDKFNIWFDIKILFKTFERIFKSENIYLEKDKDSANR